ncbi:MAG: hypothetical protein KGZ57_07595, partial [Dethiobacter sp.]|jgi:ABC-type spermidine/putrescine transport system permease subunit II|nr:hypothetical protein [Dethiobacter sp.]
VLFSESVIGILSIWLDRGVGIWGAVYGILAGVFGARGKLKTLLLSMNIASVILGMVMLGVGLYAFLSGQPDHIWFLFVRMGAILVCVFFPLFFVARAIYRMFELNKMKLKDLA